MQAPLPAEQLAVQAAAHPEYAALQQRVHAALPGWARAWVYAAGAALQSPAHRHRVGAGSSHAGAAIQWLSQHRERTEVAIAEAIARRLDPQPPRRDALEPLPFAPPRGDLGDARPLALSLIDEAQIDEEIEIARLVQAIDDAAEAPARRLAALSSALLGWPALDMRALPLAPQDCAVGLRSALLKLVPDADTRLALLRVLGTAMGEHLAGAFDELAGTLSGRGVAPAPYRVVPISGVAEAGRAGVPVVGHGTGPGTRPAAAPGAAVSGGAAVPDASDDTAGALARLVQAAREAALHEQAEAPAPPPATRGFELRLHAEPRARAGTPGLDDGTARLLMERLLGDLETRLKHSPAAVLLGPLRAPARALASPALWGDAAHPFWTLLDRLLALAANPALADASAAGAPGRVSPALERGLGQLAAEWHAQWRARPELDESQWRAAADRVQELAGSALHAQVSELTGDDAGVLDRLQGQADADELEVALRAQLLDTLASVPTSMALRRFLLGPWTQAMTQAALREGLQSAALARMGSLVDGLLRATAHPGERAERGVRVALLREAAIGLGWAGFPRARERAELEELRLVLRDPPPHREAWSEAGAPADGADPGGAPTVPPSGLDLHAGLPTVPIGFGADTTLETARHRSWADELAPGMYCRLFLQGQWLTAQLTWASASRNLFLFTSRHGGRTHSLTRRMLGKLRAAGLATQIEDGGLIAQAMRQLADSAFAPG